MNLKSTVINKSVLIVLAASGFNEDEYRVITTLLKKSGYKYFIASDAVNYCIGSYGLKVKNDISFFNARENNFNGVILIGGEGMTKYFENKIVQKLVRSFNEKRKTIGAICCAPIIIGKAGLLRGKSATCHPNYVGEFQQCGCNFLNSDVVVDGNILTSNLPGAASKFTSSFIELLNS